MTFLELLQCVDRKKKAKQEVRGFIREYYVHNELHERRLSGWYDIAETVKCTDDDSPAVYDIRTKLFDDGFNIIRAENIITWEDIVADNWEEL